MTRPRAADASRHMAKTLTRSYRAAPGHDDAAAWTPRAMLDLRSAGTCPMHPPLGPMLFGGTARHPRVHTFSGRRGSAVYDELSSTTSNTHVFNSRLTWSLGVSYAEKTVAGQNNPSSRTRVEICLRRTWI